ncbi:Cell division and transport-associated protein TolR [Magnetococcus marinus MC-1]|uniref:Cell division and transport-associated protein TolR n=1 Tax=Magnetococcus marinus (strain ATCC BAA-1437 / JCM 17883 / MC-1) TaxID=156889 RepID=A0L4V2_MAGMM|nr:protein TolR [Magnetococcus marinus]ABK42995.1 Cell division and transport-associated protein TolR [Magnetococcus marinus MC-1]
MGMNAGMGNGGVHRFQAMSDINVTPLVDIMLVLLIIFMVTAPLLTHGIEVELPHVQSDAITAQVEPLTISVSPDGSASIEGERMSLSEMTDKVTFVRKSTPSIRIFVRGDTHAAYGHVMAVMGALKAAGIEQVGLITQPNS